MNGEIVADQAHGELEIGIGGFRINVQAHEGKQDQGDYDARDGGPQHVTNV